MNNEKIFVDGLLYKLPNNNAPSFVLGKISVKARDFYEFMKKHVSDDGWVNIDVLMSKSGKPYCVLNTFTPQQDSGRQNRNPQQFEGNSGGWFQG